MQNTYSKVAVSCRFLPLVAGFGCGGGGKKYGKILKMCMIGKYAAKLGVR